MEEWLLQVALPRTEKEPCGRASSASWGIFWPRAGDTPTGEESDCQGGRAGDVFLVASPYPFLLTQNPGF